MNEKNESRTLDEILLSISNHLDKVAAAQADYEKRQAESNAAYEKRQAEYEEQRKIDNEAFKTRQAESNAAYEKRQAEYEEQRKIDKAAFEESQAAWEKRQAAAEKSMEELKRQVKSVSEAVGKHQNNIGAVTEEYFFNSIVKGQKYFFGEKYDLIKKNMIIGKNGKKYEYDIVLFNGKKLVIIEVKYKAHHDDISKIKKMAKTFRDNYPEYKDHIIYLGLASMHFYKVLESKCKENGIAMIKQVGETLMIKEGKLKEY